jgi:hypothetical protein
VQGKVEASSVWGCSRPEPGLPAAAFTGTGGDRRSAQEPQVGKLYRRQEEGGPSLLRLGGHLSRVYSGQASISAPTQGGMATDWRLERRHSQGGHEIR